jgi:ribosomal-protein-alanine N-acetyltransferase
MPDLQLVRLDHAPALLAFERENRAYFAAVIPDRGDEFFAEFDTRHAQQLAQQAAGTDYFYLLVAEGGEVVGRVNLFKVADGSAELGYRIAQKAAGQGLATAAVRKVRELAATEYGLTSLRARVTLDNPASGKVLEHNGFVAIGELTLNGKPARSYICELVNALPSGSWLTLVKRKIDGVGEGGKRDDTLHITRTRWTVLTEK